MATASQLPDDCFSRAANPMRPSSNDFTRFVDLGRYFVGMVVGNRWSPLINPICSDMTVTRIPNFKMKVVRQEFTYAKVYRDTRRHFINAFCNQRWSIYEDENCCVYICRGMVVTSDGMLLMCIMGNPTGDQFLYINTETYKVKLPKSLSKLILDDMVQHFISRREKVVICHHTEWKHYVSQNSSLQCTDEDIADHIYRAMRCAHGSFTADSNDPNAITPPHVAAYDVFLGAANF